MAKKIGFSEFVRIVDEMDINGIAIIKNTNDGLFGVQKARTRLYKQIIICDSFDDDRLESFVWEECGLSNKDISIDMLYEWLRDNGLIFIGDDGSRNVMYGGWYI